MSFYLFIFIYFQCNFQISGSCKSTQEKSEQEMTSDLGTSQKNKTSSTNEASRWNKTSSRNEILSKNETFSKIKTSSKNMSITLDHIFIHCIIYTTYEKSQNHHLLILFPNHL